jgi:hypothetical protein
MPNLKKIDVFAWLASSTHPIIDLAEVFGISLRQLADEINFRPPDPQKWHDTYFRNMFNGWGYLSKARIEAIRGMFARVGAKAEWASYAILCTKAMCEKKFKKKERDQKNKRLANKIVPFNP